MDQRTLIMSGLKRERILQAIETVTSQHKRAERSFKIAPDYDVEQVSKNVVRIIMSGLHQS